jgi:hypothetical protein
VVDETVLDTSDDDSSAPKIHHIARGHTPSLFFSLARVSRGVFSPARRATHCAGGVPPPDTQCHLPESHLPDTPWHALHAPCPAPHPVETCLQPREKALKNAQRAALRARVGGGNAS